MLEKIKEDLFNYFIGYTQSNPAIAETLTNDSWKEYAQKELEQRRFRLIESLSANELQAISNGDVDLNDIIRRAANSHQ